jgi:hypothetical protein
MSPEDQDRIVRETRAEERRFRTKGFYEQAVSCQRRADIIEQTGDYPDIPSYMDRGTSTAPRPYVDQGIFVISSSDESVQLAFTKDRAAELLLYLVTYLEWTPETLHELAFDLEIEITREREAATA